MIIFFLFLICSFLAFLLSSPWFVEAEEYSAYYVLKSVMREC